MGNTPTFPKPSHSSYLPMEMEQCFETSAYTIQTPGNYPEERIRHDVHNFTV